jgi:hypothetical protein
MQVRSFSVVFVSSLLLFGACGDEGDPTFGVWKAGTPPASDEEVNSCPTEVTTRDCAQACAHVHCCDEDISVDECMDRCEASALVDRGDRDVNCLGLRIMWRDEEGCSTILRIWHGFDDEDQCDDDRAY